jgi:hypothetical protein
MGGSVNLREYLVCISVFVGSMTASPRHVFADDVATEQARKHYQEAQKQFDMGMWDAAVVEFTKAYELRPDPNFLYNMAQAYRRGGNARRAIDLYKNFLIKVPKSPQRAEVEERIQTLQRQLDEEDRESKRTTPPLHAPIVTPEPTKGASDSLAPPRETAPTTTADHPTTADAKAATSGPTDPVPAATDTPVVAGSGTPSTPAAAAISPEETTIKTLPAQGLGSRPLRIAGIVTGAAGLAGIVGGIIFSVRTKSLSDSVSNAAQFNSADARAGNQAATLQWVCYAAGGAAVVAGALLYWRGRARTGDTTAVSLAPMVTPTHAGLLATGAF